MKTTVLGEKYMKQSETVFILGGDGFCGWPTVLKFADAGYEVVIVDNLSRREIDLSLQSSSLTKISPIEQRVAEANRKIGRVRFHNVNIAEEYQKLRDLLETYKPAVVVHFAEQRAAPYSMIGDVERRYTVDNNITGTHNVCSAIIDVSPDTHLIHLGTMGVYGYSEAFGEIPEGYLDIKITATEAETKVLYPANPGSIYHMTKCLDQLIFQFYNKNWGLKITDLHQGIVWGIETELTKSSSILTNRFDYDGIYGTVINRFLSQAAAGKPLSVYGSGGQSRAFIHIEDTTNCIMLAAINSNFDKSKVRILNQVSEVKSVLQLAKLVSELYDVDIAYIKNPRKELESNQLYVANSGFKNLGFNPILLNERLIDDVNLIAESNSDSMQDKNINNSPTW